MKPLRLLAERRWLAYALCAAYMGAIYLASSTPGSDLPPSIGPHSGMLHFLEYLGLGVLLYAASWDSRSPVLYSFTVAFMFAISDEVHQLFVPGRFFSLWDMASDFAGSYSGIIAAKRWGGL